MAAYETMLAARLRRARWFAGGLVALMGLVFISTAFLPEAAWLTGLVRAFSEAALIGGLADWFAVTALFRHPFGIPIPHTAIVPTRKNEIGEALAGFVAEHFLVREAVERRLARTDLASRVGVWLEDGANAELVSRDVSRGLDWLLTSGDNADLRRTMREGLAHMLEKVAVTDALAALIEVLASGNNAQALIDQLVQFGRDQLERNKLTIRARIEERSPWWMPRFVDEEIYDQLVSEFERLLSEIGDDPEHPARREFNDRLHDLRESLVSDPAVFEKGAALRDEFVRHAAVQQFFHDLWEKVHDYLQASFADPDSPIRLSIAHELRHVGGLLKRDARARERLNSWIREIFAYVVENYRGPLSEVISDTIAEWDAKSTSERIELHIGKDLQFIRINGTVVGGLVGVVIYLVWMGLGL